MPDLNVNSADEQQARQDRLDEAYAADGRHDPGHPRHATYTGLMAPAQTLQENDPSRVTATWMRLKGKKRSARRSSFLRTVRKL